MVGSSESGGDGPIYFCGQKVFLQRDLELRNNSFLSIGKQSMLKKPESIEPLLTAGRKGEVFEIRGDSLVVKFNHDTSSAFYLEIKRTFIDMALNVTNDIFRNF